MQIRATASHYGLPIIVLECGNALDLFSWVALGYQIVRASRKEKVQLEKIFANFEMMLPPRGYQAGQEAGRVVNFAK